MLTRALSTSRFVGALAGLVLSLSFFVGCGGTPTCEASCSSGGSGGASSSGGSGGSASCTTTKGTITGTVYQGSGPGMSNGQVVPNALINLVVSPGGPGSTALQGKADDMGNFSVELDPATWIVGGDDGSGCINSEPITVTLDACETETIEIVLDICSG